MPESTLYSPDASLQSQLADYYLWEAPGKGVRIYMNLATVDLLQTQALRSAGSLSSRGTEVGGLLLGTTGLDGVQITAVVEDFESVPCSYCKGPQYSFTDADADNLEDALARSESGARRGLSVVGYYRSHNRDDLYLSADDLDLIQNRFSAPDKVFLVIKTLPIGACTAGFFFWEHGRIQSEFPYLEVPLGPVQSLSPTVPEPATTETLEDLLALLPAPAPRELKPESVPPALVRPGRQRKRVFAAAVAVAALGVVTYKMVTTPAISTGGAPSSPFVINPSEQKTPAKQTVSLPAAIANPKPDQDKPTYDKPSQGSSVSDPPQDSADASSPLVPDNPTAPAPLPKPPAATVEEPALPLPAEAKITASVALPPGVELSPPPAIEQRRVETEERVPTVTAPAAESQVPEQTAITRFTRPQIIYRVTPAVPLEVRPIVSGEIQIDVTVRIDQEGKVIGAEVTATRGAAARLVAAEALRAARLFRFRPAQENDKAVPGSMVLTFRFRRPGA